MPTKRPYFAFEFLKDETTFHGEPSKVTGRRSVAGELYVFGSTESRRKFMRNKEKIIIVNSLDVFKYFYGLTKDEVEEMKQKMFIDRFVKINKVKEVLV